MTTQNVFIGVVAIGAVLGALAFFALTPFHFQVAAVAGSPVGSTFSTAKIAAVDWSPNSTSATTTSVYNGDASPRFIKSLEYGCTAIGTAYTSVAALTITVATTSTSAPLVLGNTNYIVNAATFSTSSVTTTFSSSTQALGGAAVNSVWAPGSYVTFAINATSSASCVIGVSYLGS